MSNVDSSSRSVRRERIIKRSHNNVGGLYYVYISAPTACYDVVVFNFRCNDVISIASSSAATGYYTCQYGLILKYTIFVLINHLRTH